MNEELINRVQEDLKKIEELKVQKIEAETKIKTIEESIESDLEKAKELGYNSLEELDQAQKDLEEKIKEECDKLESSFNSIVGE